jgi:hypothetical protein
MRTISYFAATMLLAFAPAALANSINLTINSSVHVTADSPNDNYWGTYGTLPDAFGTQGQVRANFQLYGTTISTTFSNVSFLLPAGSVVTSATMNLVFPLNRVDGTGIVDIAPETLPPPDDDASGTHILPKFGPATSFFNIDGVTLQQSGSNVVSDGNFFPNTPTITGDKISTGTWDLSFITSGGVVGPVTAQGYDWNGYIGGNGQADIPYSVQVDVNYSTVPEPPGFLLVATAMAIGLVAVGHRKWSPS